MRATTTTVLGGKADLEHRIRFEWAESLSEHMAAQNVNKYELQRRLARLGVDVSRQSIENWMKGVVSPRPHHQVAIGTALTTPARRLFNIENLPEPLPEAS